MRLETGYQVNDLPKLLLPPANVNCLFVGSGDSFVAGLVAQHISGNQALCCYPTDVISNPSIVNGHNVYFVSISGRTKANIMAAQVAKHQGVHTVAVTTKPDSRLAQVCDEVIELKYKKAGVPTSGTISFTSSMLTCISLATKATCPMNLREIYRHAEKTSEKMVKEMGQKNTSYIILGNSILFPVAIYAGLKLNEVLGAKAMAYQTEEFCHSSLFGAKTGDQIIILGTNARMDNSEIKLSQRLKKVGFHTAYVDCRNGSIESLLYSIFFVQHIVSRLAEKYRLSNCYFLKNKVLLGTSSDFIFD